MPHHVVNKVQDCLNDFGKPVKGSKILVLGIAYKADIDDMRESPSLELISLLEKKGASVDYHDPFFSEIGMSREYSRLAGRQCKPLSKDYDGFCCEPKTHCDIVFLGWFIVYDSPLDFSFRRWSWWRMIGRGFVGDAVGIWS